MGLQTDQPAPPPSPSWISLRSHRSASLPRIRRARGDSYTATVEDTSSPTDKRSWATKYFPGFYRAPQSFPPSSETRYQKPPPLRRTPVLILALLKLDKQLSTYCSYIADPSLENVAAACDLLSRTIATASPQTGSERGSPASLGSPKSSSPLLLQSPSRSTIGSFFGNSGSPPPHQATSSALALEEEWERFTMPLFLLGGAEALYGSLGHAQDSFVAFQLDGLYQRIINDINLVRETLCDPFTIGGQSSQELLSSTLMMYYERAISVALTLHGIVNVAQMRCRLIQFQSTLWESKKPKFGEWIRLLETIRVSVPAEDESSFAEPIVRAFRKEVEAWKFLMETAHSLERCRFSETILNCQKTKMRLNCKSDTRMQQWLLRTLQRLISMFQIYFDRVHAFAKPLYGFDSGAALRDTDENKDARIGGAKNFMDDLVLDFIQTQQKLGTSAVAVTVVLDAVRTSNFRMERGFTVVDSSVDESQLSDLETTRLQWPAVYMRTTKHHGVTQAGGGLLGVKRRTSNRKLEDEQRRNASITEHYIRWSSDASGPARTNDAAKEKDVLLNFQEYAPGSGSSSWPHSEWNNLVHLINEKEKPPLPQSTSESLDISDDGFFKFLANGGLSSFLESEPSPSPTTTGLKRTIDHTSFYITPLNDFASLIVMTKAEEESRWHRRRGSKIEDDVEKFLDDFSCLLRVADLFRASHDQEIRRNATAKQHGIDFVQEVRNGGNWNDEDVQDLVQSLKVAFGLQSNLKPFAAEPLNPSYKMGLRLRKSPKLRQINRTSAKLDVSAVAFFLGTDLMHAVSHNERTKLKV